MLRCHLRRKFRESPLLCGVWPERLEAVPLRWVTANQLFHFARCCLRCGKLRRW
jgi:hypothetical protein